MSLSTTSLISQHLKSIEPWRAYRPWCFSHELEPTLQISTRDQVKHYSFTGRTGAPLYDLLVRPATLEKRDVMHVIAIIVDRLIYPLFALFSLVFYRDNHLARLLKDWEARDMVLKFAVASSETAAYIAEQHGVHSQKVGHLHAIRQGLDDARLAVGLLNIFAGVIPGLVGSLSRIVYLGKEFYEPRSNLSRDIETNRRLRNQLNTIGEIENWVIQNIEIREVDAIWRDRVRSRIEIALDVVHELAEVGSCATYLAMFGVCRPILFVERHIGELGSRAHQIGRAFGFFVMANHAASFVSSTAHLLVLYLGKDDYFRQMQDLYLTGDPKTPHMASLAETQYNLKAVHHLLNLLDQGVSLFLDAIRNFEAVSKALPPPVYLSLHLTSASIGLVRVWIRTA